MNSDVYAPHKHVSQKLTCMNALPTNVCFWGNSGHPNSRVSRPVLTATLWTLHPYFKRLGDAQSITILHRMRDQGSEAIAITRSPQLAASSFSVRTAILVESVPGAKPFALITAAASGVRRELTSALATSAFLVSAMIAAEKTMVS